ncbi:MAG: hypothetical protein ABFC98_01125 [Candidatus Cloacimonas sp.]
MKNILKNQSGNVAIAMLLVVIGAMSGLTMSSLAMRDVIATNSELEDVQSTHLLRSEAGRGQAYLEVAAKRDPEIMGGIRTPVRKVSVSGSHYLKTYTMQSVAKKVYKESEENVVEVGGVMQGSFTGESSTYYQISSLVEGRTGSSDVYYGRKNLSLTRKYGELSLVQDTGPVFMYFTDSDLSPNDTNVYFYGYDVINGPVHSNTDIQIKQAGGGNNNGWPTFLAIVTTSGEVVSTPATYPRDTIFRGGLIEHYDEYDFPENMVEIRSLGDRVGSAWGEDQILMLTLDGYQADGWQGQIIPSRKQLPMYPTYPMGYPYAPGSETTINYFPVADTIWSPYSTSARNGGAYYAECKLWIGGTISGFQTWASTDTMWLVDDLLYQHTSIGDSPLDNDYDMLGLVSEKSIIIKYAYRGQADSVRYHTNMGADSAVDNGIWIYAAMAALGRGTNCHEDGVFTFEYQHPHGSIPAVKFNPANDTPDAGMILFDWIDIHRNYWPQSSSHPWPGWLDFPWYNPIWPELHPYCERGTINIWGGVNQRRRGFVHRNYYDNEYPSGGAWNPPIDYCGNSSSPTIVTNVQLYQNPNVVVTLNTRHYDGAAGTGVGYKKNYNYDTRMYNRKPPCWPYFKRQGERLPLAQGSWFLKKPPRNLI